VIPFIDGKPCCERCGHELDDGSVTACPSCQFSPRQKGLRVALIFVMGVVVSMTLLMLSPSAASILLPAAALSFVAAFAVFFLSFLATPSRLGSLFLWP